MPSWTLQNGCPFLENCCGRMQTHRVSLEARTGSLVFLGALEISWLGRPKTKLPKVTLFCAKASSKTHRMCWPLCCQGTSSWHSGWPCSIQQVFIWCSRHGTPFLARWKRQRLLRRSDRTACCQRLPDWMYNWCSSLSSRRWCPLDLGVCVGWKPHGWAWSWCIVSFDRVGARKHAAANVLWG